MYLVYIVLTWSVFLNNVVFHQITTNQLSERKAGAWLYYSSTTCWFLTVCVKYIKADIYSICTDGCMETAGALQTGECSHAVQTDDSSYTAVPADGVIVL